MAARPRAPEDRRAQLLEVAVRLLRASVPFDDLSMERVAAEAGVSPPLVYHYFKNKRGFRVALLRAGADSILAELNAAEALDRPATVETGVSRFIETFLSNPSTYQALVRLMAGGDEQVREIHRSIRIGFAAWVKPALADRDIADGPALDALLAGWSGFVEEVVTEWLRDPVLSQAEIVSLCTTAFYRLLQL